MAIKDELKADVKDDGGGQDELEALDALEKEAAEFNQVSPCHSRPSISLFTQAQDAEIDRIIKAIKLDAWVSISFNVRIPVLVT